MQSINYCNIIMKLISFIVAACFCAAALGLQPNTKLTSGFRSSNKLKIFQSRVHGSAQYHNSVHRAISNDDIEYDTDGSRRELLDSILSSVAATGPSLTPPSDLTSQSTVSNESKQSGSNKWISRIRHSLAAFVAVAGFLISFPGGAHAASRRARKSTDGATMTAPSRQSRRQNRRRQQPKQLKEETREREDVAVRAKERTGQASTKSSTPTLPSSQSLEKLKDSLGDKLGVLFEGGDQTRSEALTKVGLAVAGLSVLISFIVDSDDKATTKRGSAKKTSFKGSSLNTNKFKIPPPPSSTSKPMASKLKPKSAWSNDEEEEEEEEGGRGASSDIAKFAKSPAAKSMRKSDREVGFSLPDKDALFEGMESVEDIFDEEDSSKNANVAFSSSSSSSASKWRGKKEQESEIDQEEDGVDDVAGDGRSSRRTSATSKFSGKFGSLKGPSFESDVTATSSKRLRDMESDDELDDVDNDGLDRISTKKVQVVPPPPSPPPPPPPPPPKKNIFQKIFAKPGGGRSTDLQQVLATKDAAAGKPSTHHKT